jgi:hypothetical protein
MWNFCNSKDAENLIQAGYTPPHKLIGKSFQMWNKYHIVKYDEYDGYGWKKT